MTTAFPTDLSKLISADLVTYLGAGVLNRNRIARAADYSGLRIEEFDRLKQLHFVLQDDVVEYVEALPSRLRRVKTTHRRTETAVRGEVRGRINWPRTTERRTAAGYDDRTLFVVENPTIEVNIPENKVVKKVLSLLSEPLTEEIENTEQEWRAAWDDADIVALQQTLAQNVYLDALPEPAAIRLTDRDLTTARRARQPLYTEAAELYRLYDDLMNDRFHRSGVQELLQETIVTPTQDHKLFELFCVFALIRRLRQQYPNLQLRRVQPGTDAIAILENEHSRVEVYYDKGGPLSFFEAYPRPEELVAYDGPEMFERQAAALSAHEELVQEFLAQGSQQTFYSGRPDFIALRWGKDPEGTKPEVIIGEVKYTRTASTFSDGLRELLGYMHFARHTDDYLFEEPLEATNLFGVLCTDGVVTEASTVGQVHHWDTESLKQSFNR